MVNLWQETTEGGAPANIGRHWVDETEVPEATFVTRRTLPLLTKPGLGVTESGNNFVVMNKTLRPLSPSSRPMPSGWVSCPR